MISSLHRKKIPFYSLQSSFYPLIVSATVSYIPWSSVEQKYIWSVSQVSKWVPQRGLGDYSVETSNYYLINKISMRKPTSDAPHTHPLLFSTDDICKKVRSLHSQVGASTVHSYYNKQLAYLLSHPNGNQSKIRQQVLDVHDPMATQVTNCLSHCQKTYHSILTGIRHSVHRIVDRAFRHGETKGTLLTITNTSIAIDLWNKYWCYHVFAVVQDETIQSCYMELSKHISCYYLDTQEHVITPLTENNMYEHFQWVHMLNVRKKIKRYTIGKYMIASCLLEEILSRETLFDVSKFLRHVQPYVLCESFIAMTARFHLSFQKNPAVFAYLQRLDMYTSFDNFSRLLSKYGYNRSLPFVKEGLSFYVRLCSAGRMESYIMKQKNHPMRLPFPMHFWSTTLHYTKTPVVYPTPNQRNMEKIFRMFLQYTSKHPFELAVPPVEEIYKQSADEELVAVNGSMFPVLLFYYGKGIRKWNQEVYYKNRPLRSGNQSNGLSHPPPREMAISYETNLGFHAFETYRRNSTYVSVFSFTYKQQIEIIDSLQPQPIEVPIIYDPFTVSPNVFFYFHDVLKQVQTSEVINDPTSHGSALTSASASAFTYKSLSEFLYHMWGWYATMTIGPIKTLRNNIDDILAKYFHKIPNDLLPNIRSLIFLSSEASRLYESLIIAVISNDCTYFYDYHDVFQYEIDATHNEIIGRILLNACTLQEHISSEYRHTVPFISKNRWHDICLRLQDHYLFRPSGVIPTYMNEPNSVQSCISRDFSYTCFMFLLCCKYYFSTREGKTYLFRHDNTCLSKILMYAILSRDKRMSLIGQGILFCPPLFTFIAPPNTEEPILPYYSECTENEKFFPFQDDSPKVNNKTIIKHYFEKAKYTNLVPYEESKFLSFSPLINDRNYENGPFALHIDNNDPYYFDPPTLLLVTLLKNSEIALTQAEINRVTGIIELICETQATNDSMVHTTYYQCLLQWWKKVSNDDMR